MYLIVLITANWATGMSNTYMYQMERGMIFCFDSGGVSKPVVCYAQLYSSFVNYPCDQFVYAIVNCSLSDG